MSRKFNVPKNEISSHFVQGNSLESDVWQKLPSKEFDIIFARRFFSIFEKPEGALKALLKQCNDYCKPTATVVLDWMPQSGAEVDGAFPNSILYGIRTIRSHPTALHDARLTSKIEVSDLEVWMTNTELKETEQQTRQRLQSVGAEIVDLRAPKYRIAPPERISNIGNGFWEKAKLLKEGGREESLMQLADEERRLYRSKPSPSNRVGSEHIIMHSIFVSVRGRKIEEEK